MPTQAQIQAVLNNGAGLPQDSLLRSFVKCRYSLPDDSITKAINKDSWLSFFWDREGLLNPELDFYIDWTDFCYWFESKTKEKYLSIPAGTPLPADGDIGTLIQQAIDNSIGDLAKV